MKKSPHIRPVWAFDAQDVAQIAQRRFAAQWPADAYLEETKRDDSIFLVVDDGKILGYVLCRLVDNEAQLLDFAVTQDGQGLGQALWLSLLKAAKERGATKITWEVSSANTRALLFYRRIGAKVVGRRAKFYNDGSDAILMDCSLT